MAYQGATRARRFFQTTNTSAPSQLVQNTRCNEHFLKRVRENDAIKNEAKKKGQKANVKRVPPGPRPGKLVSGEVCVLEAQPYTENYF